MATRTHPASGMTRALTRRVLAQADYERIGEQRAADARSNSGVLRASGLRIQSMAADKLRAVAGNRQPWQVQAWGYRDLIGELRQALQFRARAISKVAFLVAQVNPDPDDEPLPVAMRKDRDDQGKPTEKSQAITLPEDLCAAAEQELNRLPIQDGYSFAGVWSENFDVAGDCWLHGRHTDDGQEEWKIRSILDVDIQGSTLTVKDETGQPRRLDLGRDGEPGTEEIYRLWIPHPARGHLADSALNACRDVLEDICLTGRELRAAARSRIAANGAWMVPNGMAQLRNVRADDENPADGPNSFMAMLQAAMLAPIANEGDPGSVVPLILTGSREDIEVASKSFVRFSREDSPTLLDKLEKSLGRMAVSLDIPPEQLTGMGDVNHWTAWQIDNATFRHYLEPSIRLMVDSLTVAFLRTALIARGFPAEQVNQVRVWYDAGQLTENPNRRQDAIDARDRAAISDDAFRQALGFNEADAPSPEEQLLMIAVKNGIDPAAATAILAWFAEQNNTGAPILPTQPAPPRQIAPGRPAPPPVDQPGGDPNAAAPGGAGTPDTAPAGVAASAVRLCVVCGEFPALAGGTQCHWHTRNTVRAAGQLHPDDGYRLDTETSRGLAEIERAVRADVLRYADAALQRALERAGSRLRAKATRNPQLSAELRQFHVTEWAARIGPTQCMALGADARFLLAEAWTALKAQFIKLVGYAVDEITSRVAGRLLGLSGQPRERAQDRMRRDMLARVEPAWSALEQALEQHAERELFGQKEEPTDGELHDFTVPPGLVRTALAEIGGLPETSGGIHAGRSITGEPINGLSNGSAVARELDAAGVLTVGYLWVYGVTPQLRRFEPHWDLEGVRFTDWADPKLHPDARYAWVGPFYRPGDHGGCMCDFVPGYAVPDYATQVRDRLSVPTGPTQDILDLAALDDQAGRKGTTAQAIRDQHAAVQALQARFLGGA